MNTNAAGAKAYLERKIKKYESILDEAYEDGNSESVAFAEDLLKSLNEALRCVKKVEQEEGAST